MDGFNYYENEDDEDSYIFTATGITYSVDGQGLECGDFEDYLNILANGLKEHLNFYCYEYAQKYERCTI